MSVRMGFILAIGANHDAKTDPSIDPVTFA